MEKKITLQDVAVEVSDITVIVKTISVTLNSLMIAMNNGFARIDKRFDGVDARFEILEKRVGSLEYRFGGLEADLRMIDLKLDDNVRNTGLIRKRIDLMEAIMHDIQKDIEGFNGEMKGIHKVLDRFDKRTTRLDKHAGFKIKAAAV